MDNLDSPPRIHGEHRSNRRFRDSCRARRQLRDCPESTRRRLNQLFSALNVDTVEQELASDANVDGHLSQEQSLTFLGNDEFWEVARRNNIARQKEIDDAAAAAGTGTNATTTPSASTSTGAVTETQTKPTVSPAENSTGSPLGQDQRLTAQDEIKSIIMARRDATTHMNSDTDNTPSASTAASTNAAAGTSIQLKRKASEELERTEYSPGLISSLNWFLKNKESIGNTDVPGGSSSGNQATTQASIITNDAPPTSTFVGSTASTQTAPEPTGETVQTEYSPGLVASLDWFLQNKDKIGNSDVPGGSSGGASGHGNVPLE
ncbi:hypothetical protein SMACR_08729 [Sordaria macrospora]|uniref:Uncharacterized protein n=1 Tax=Sordaria macrospora TaxID=5147 RepID=A0A8S8ZYI2_SORMA|nr:hypothetical protein SMACR_08729 [Sordaria macrospora]KAH7625639.1 hypothetical protein B0T09DRAFT_377381 [Sordaria sp. MPI-SDFR-AT-0083]WPJ66138.1 hypothetical protein SMAC4_08729 [Sordaria macrospora]